MMVERLIATAPTLMVKIESPVDDNACCDRDGHKIIVSTPAQTSRGSVDNLDTKPKERHNG